MTKKNLFFIISLILLLFFTFVINAKTSSSQEVEDQKSIYFDKGRVIIFNDNGKLVEFTVEVADNKKKRQRGLMFTMSCLFFSAFFSATFSTSSLLSSF